MIQNTRIAELNQHPIKDGQYVLYWMQASQRTRCNHALEYAIEQANRLRLPLYVCFGLMDDYPEASERHYAFMLQGLADVAKNLRERGIGLVIRNGNPPMVALECARRAALLVCDRGYLRHQRKWREQVGNEAICKAVQVESDVVCPVEQVSDKSEFAARTIRPKIHRIWKDYLVDLRQDKLAHPAPLKLPLESTIDLSDVSAALAKMKIDRSVKPTTRFVGGEDAGGKLLGQFIERRLSGYKEKRNEPVDDATSHLSAYLHFGQVSPLQIALAAMKTDAPAEDRDSLLEELIVRRELSVNYVFFTGDYDRFDALPNWAKLTLAKHARDQRPMIYTLDQLEQAQTHDPYWNAAQREMTQTGFMQNYMRMYWGKKILEWTSDPSEAFARTLHLNNKYFLDGRDPNAYANVAWIYGCHDRPWTERPIFGTVRYMNAGGLERKFDIHAYARKW